MNDEWQAILITAGFERIDDVPTDDVRQHWHRATSPDEALLPYGQGFDVWATGFTAYDWFDTEWYGNTNDVQRHGATTGELRDAIEWLDLIRRDDEQ